MKNLKLAIVLLLLSSISFESAWAGSLATINLDVRDYVSYSDSGSSWSGGTGTGMNPGDNGSFFYRLPLNTSQTLAKLTAYVYDNDLACDFTVSLVKKTITDTNIENFATVSTSSASADSVSPQAVTLNISGIDQTISPNYLYYGVISLTGTASNSCSVNGLKISGVL